jgi:hypothetical protein
MFSLRQNPPRLAYRDTDLSHPETVAASGPGAVAINTFE